MGRNLAQIRKRHYGHYLQTKRWIGLFTRNWTANGITLLAIKRAINSIYYIS